MALAEDSLNAKIAELENKAQPSQMSFSEIMDILYTKSGAKIGENDYLITPSDFVSMTYENVSEDIENIEYTDVRVIDGEIDFYMNKVEPIKDISVSIKGISEEIVSIEIADTVYPDTMHSSTTLIASTYTGEKIDILEYTK